jgi:hypothetical protein
MESPKRAKVMFRDDEGNVETLWASDLGADRYRLDNTPWFAFGVSWHDVVEARPTEAGGIPQFVRVLEKSGFRTIRLILDPPASESSQSMAILDRLCSLGCSYEGANPRYISIDIPPAVDLMAIRELLVSLNLQWEHADPPYEDLFPNRQGAA